MLLDHARTWMLEWQGACFRLWPLPLAEMGDGDSGQAATFAWRNLGLGERARRSARWNKYQNSTKAAMRES